MKVVIFAGGLGTRLTEETSLKPKPMVEIGGKPILWHIMKIYSHYGYNDFIICLGYKGYMIKEYFINYFLYNSDITVELHNNQLDVHYTNSESFKVTLVDTGVNSNTAERLKRVEKYINDDTFMLTYGDGVSDVNIAELLAYHMNHGKIATLTTIQHPGRFGNLEFDDNGNVETFAEKPLAEGLWVNGGYFVLNKKAFKYLDGDMSNIQFEYGPLPAIAADGELSAYKHNGYWKAMDALRDKIELEQEWESGNTRWKIWQ